MQTEHQRQISRGGRGGTTVTACVRCNALKGPLDVEEFREASLNVLALPSTS
ncbi:MAG: hypothetical protein JO296_19560 [Pseudonocardiales bacterium]|nr:hypothetical protein [Pseudonocardiales bacterium]